MITDIQLKSAFDSALSSSQGQTYNAIIGKIAANFSYLGIPETEALNMARVAYPNQNPSLPTGEPITSTSTFFEKYKWYIIILLLIAGGYGMYWSYKNLSGDDKEETKEKSK